MNARPTHLCQLATDWRGDVPAGGMMLETKVDGWRAVFLPDHTGQRRLFSRNGMPLEGVDHIVHRLEEMEREAGAPTVFDGEFQVAETLLATKAWCESGWKKGGEAGQFFAFDAMPLAEWRAGGSDRPLIDRKKALVELAGAVERDAWTWRAGSRGRDAALPPVVVIEDGWAFDARDVMREAQRVWSAGGEGLVLKDATAPYRRNRSEAWQKVKQGNMHKWMRAAA